MNCVLGIALTTCTTTTARRAPTRVARVQDVRTGVQDFDAWFMVVHSMQVAVNETERVKLQIVSRLGSALGLGESAELEACAAAVRSRAETLLRSDKRIAFQFDAQTTLDAAPPALTGPRAGAVFPVPQPETEPTIQVSVAVENGPLPQSADEMATAVRIAIRGTLAVRKRMHSMVVYGPQILAIGRELLAGIDARAPRGASELQPEFRDALEFLEGLGSRANVEAQSAYRIAVRLQASAVVHPPEDEEAEQSRRAVLSDAALALDAVPDTSTAPSDAWWPADNGAAEGRFSFDGGRVDAWHPPDAGPEDVARSAAHRRR